MANPLSSRQRLLALLRGQPTDRIGVHIIGVRPFTPWWMAQAHPSYQPLIDLVRERTDHIVPLGFDSGFYTSMAPLRIERFTEPDPRQADVQRQVVVVHGPRGPLTSVHVTHAQVQVPMPHEHFVKTPADLENLLAIPYVPPRPDIRPFLALDRTLGERGLVMVGLGSDPIGDVHSLLGSENLALWSVERRDLLHRLLAEMLRRKIDLLQHFEAAGLFRQMTVLVGHAGAEIVVPPLHGPEDFREFCVRYDRPMHEVIHAAGGYVHVHCHGSLRAILEDFVVAGTDMLHPVECPPEGDTPLVEAKRRIGNKLVIEGNIQFSRLCDDPPDIFRQRVSTTIAEGQPGGRFILCPTASPYQKILPPNILHNYQTLIELAHSEGGY